MARTREPPFPLYRIDTTVLSSLALMVAQCTLYAVRLGRTGRNPRCCLLLKLPSEMTSRILNKPSQPGLKKIRHLGVKLEPLLGSVSSVPL